MRQNATLHLIEGFGVLKITDQILGEFFGGNVLSVHPVPIRLDLVVLGGQAVHYTQRIKGGVQVSLPRQKIFHLLCIPNGLGDNHRAMHFPQPLQIKADVVPHQNLCIVQGTPSMYETRHTWGVRQTTFLQHPKLHHDVVPGEGA